VLAVAAGVAYASSLAFTSAPGSPFAVDLHPNSIGAGDLNGDKNVDLVTPSEDSNSVSILLGDRDGAFVAASSAATGTSPESVAVGDLNRDRRLDVVTANGGSDDLSVLLGDGTGGFSAPVTVPAGDGAWFVAIGNVNGDRNPDLAVSNLFANSVSVFLGNGGGGFAAAATVPVGTFPYGIAIADLNRDRMPDLAVANQFAASVSILLGNGSGGFTPAPGSPIAVGSGPSWVAAADLNDDENGDLAVANQGSDTVSILLGDGAGGFTSAAGSPVLVGNCFRPGGACAPTGIGVSDLDGDGKLDLATGNIFSDNVSVLLGDGSGGFATASGSPFAVGDRPFSLAIARLNRDGKSDIAAANYGPTEGPSNVSVLLNAR
jgi:hypothetical protein